MHVPATTALLVEGLKERGIVEPRHEVLLPWRSYFTRTVPHVTGLG